MTTEPNPPSALAQTDRSIILDFVSLATAVDTGRIPAPDVLTEMLGELDPELAGLIIAIARELARTAVRLHELEGVLHGRLLS